MSRDRRMDDLMDSLQERAKELRCLYRVTEALRSADAPLDEVFDRVLRAMPEGWQYPGICRPLVRIGTRTWRASAFQPSPWGMAAPLVVEGVGVGELCVYYAEQRPDQDEGPFLREERQLLEALADRISLFLLQRDREQKTRRGAAHADAVPGVERDWRLVIDVLRRTDPRLLRRITIKMLNLLRWKGVEEVEHLFHEEEAPQGTEAENRPGPRTAGRAAPSTEQVFALAEGTCTPEEILGCIEMWMGQDKVGFLLDTVEEQSSSLADITEALERFQVLGMEEEELPATVQTTLRVALLRRFFTDQLAFINIAKGLTTIADFQALVQHVLHPPRSHGKLGGKSAGLFLARKVVEAAAESTPILADIRVPRTWYLASDCVVAFVRYNNLDDVHDRKYLDVEQVRQQYPHVVQVFKAASFPPELVKGLSSALDDLGEVPLIVRSSSLLEDRIGAVFSGKYKSLFLANQGKKAERLQALLDAIAEVYASMFGPDPIEYRAERNLLDVHEEMGIMIQEVVGVRVGPYFLPSFSGVAFSNNEFRWSPRIRREDGLVRLVMGLGTRAVDRLSDDYPVLLAPGQPGLRVNASVDEVMRYAPKMVDLINLETNGFETIPVARLLAECGDGLPMLRRMISRVEGDRIRRAGGLADAARSGPTVVTFEGLATETPFMARMATLLRVLQDRLGTPVDVEFACDGEHLYLLQCRPQSYGGLDAPPEIPREIAPERLLFSAHRYVSNGRVEGLTHVVYVDPETYAGLARLEDLRDVGRAVGRLNKVLPKRRFILMGPGRWGSRGDIRLGVSVGYADISNTALLVEMAHRTGNYVPDLSFGTHFFQDLVERGIRYLPLYPDEAGSHLDVAFLRGAPNLLPALLPDFAHLESVVRVIEVPSVRDGLLLHVLMNGDTDTAVGLFCEPGGVEACALAAQPGLEAPPATPVRPAVPEDHWGWRMTMAERLAALTDPRRFAVRGMWVYGSTRSGTARPDSDLDLLIHFDGDATQRRELGAWLDGWGRALEEANFLRTGRRVRGLLDWMLVSHEDLEARRGLAGKVAAVTDAARSLRVGTEA